jgi:transaldolase
MNDIRAVQTGVLHQFYDVGQQIWLDNLSRTLIREGTLQHLIDQGLSGLTSNPAIFQKAFAESPYYQEDIGRVKNGDLSAEQRFECLAIPDIQAACDLFAPLFQKTRGNAGFVSLEVSPNLAYDTEGTVAAARRLKQAVKRDNLLVKIPGTPEGAKAIQQCISEGISINVTLLFNLEQLKAVQDAYINGLRTYIQKGGDPAKVKSVASFFLSRIDTLVDKRLDEIGSQEALALRGKSALSIAKLAYRQYAQLFHGDAFNDLAAKGGTRQFPLWASTSVKNKAYPPLLYVIDLIGPETVNTLPDATLETLIEQGAQLRQEGKISNNVVKGTDAADDTLAALKRLGIDMKDVGEQLQKDGVRLFEEAFGKLLGQIC